MDRRTIGLIWVGGIVLMVAIYAIGPEHFIATCEQAIADAVTWLGDLIDTLMLRAFEAVRAAAIGLYVVFVVLAVMAMRRGQRTGGMLVVVSIVFLLLVRTNWYGSDTRWFAAAVVTAVAALVLTQRLLRGPGLRGPGDPWGMGWRRGGGSDPQRAPPGPPQ